MALIKCPECGKEISDKSINCINCGYPLKSVGVTPTVNETAQNPYIRTNETLSPADQLALNVSEAMQNENKAFNKRKKGRGIALLLGFIVGLVVFSLGGENAFSLLDPVLPVTVLCLFLWVLSIIFKESSAGARFLAYPFWFVLTFIPSALVGTFINMMLPF